MVRVPASVAQALAPTTRTHTVFMTKPEHRSTDSALVSILVDVILTLKVQGRTIEEIVTEAQAIAETEWYFAEAQIRGGE